MGGARGAAGSGGSVSGGGGGVMIILDFLALSWSKARSKSSQFDPRGGVFSTI